MSKFEIDEQFLTDVFYEETRSFTVVETGERFENVRMTGSKDHPEFDALRSRIADEGLINKVTTFWNGDTVLKPFELNGFPCAVALGIAMRVASQAG